MRNSIVIESRGRPAMHPACNATVAALLGVFLATVGFGSPSACATESENPNSVVATVGQHKITEKDLDAKIKPQLAAMQNKLVEMKRQALQSMADQYLIDQAASKAGLSAGAYVKKEVDDKAGKVSEAEAKKFFDDHKLGERYKFPEVKQRLIAVLEHQRVDERRKALIDDLRKTTPVKILIETPRVAVNSAGHPVLGPDNAPVTIVEFGDFQCPFCERAEASLKAVREKYGDKIKLVFMDFPLPAHNHAMDAAKAARCANEQGKFWPYHDALFTDQSKLAPADLKATAKRLGLDSKRFDACVDSNKYEAAVLKDEKYGEQVGVDGTPTFYIDGRSLVGAQPFPQFAEIIDDELQHPGAQQAAAR
jgi:protein-disulfide isomerase